MITENLSTLKIHKLTQEQYDRALEAGNIDESALYLTPEKEPILIQNDEPTDVEDGTLWLDLDAVGQSSSGGSVFYDGEMVYSQNYEPIGAPDGTLWVDLDDNEGVAGGGDSSNCVKSVNGVIPDENGNVQIEVGGANTGLPSGGTAGQFLSIGSDGSPTWVSLTASEEVQF